MREVTRILYNRTYDSDMSHHVCDVARISECMENLGYRASDHDIYLAYFDYSEEYATDWLGLPEEEAEFTSLVEMLIDRYFTKFGVEDK